MLASWPKVKLPPTCGHLKVSAETAVAMAAVPATAQNVERMARRNMNKVPRWRGRCPCAQTGCCLQFNVARLQRAVNAARGRRASPPASVATTRAPFYIR